MNWKEFFEPKWNKLIAFFIIYFLAANLHVAVPVLGILNINILSPLSYVQGLGGSTVEILMMSGLWSLASTLNLIYQYVLGCVIIFIVRRLRKNDSKI